MLFESCMFWKKIHQFIQASTVQDCIPNCFCMRIKFKLAVIVKPHFLPFFLRNVMSVKVGPDFLFIFLWTPWIIWFHSLCLQDHQLVQKLTSFFLLRKPWWTTLCRWSPTLLTLVTLWCWWRDGSSKGRTATLLLPPDLRRNASWFATCFLQRMWVHVSTAVFGCSANPAAFWFVIPLIRGLVAAPAPAHYTTWSVWPLAEKPTNELTVEGLVTISFTLLKITSRFEWAVWVGELFQLGLVFSPKQPQSSPECKTGLAVVPVFHFWQDWIGQTVSFSILITSGTPRAWGCSVY